MHQLPTPVPSLFFAQYILCFHCQKEMEAELKKRVYKWMGTLTKGGRVNIHVYLTHLSQNNSSGNEYP